MGETRWLRADTTGQPVGVEGRNVLGYVMAQAGTFKSEGRGEFDERSLASIVRLVNRQPNGVKSRLGHPTLSDDGVGRILGRSSNARLDEAKTPAGKVPAVRADLAVSETAVARGYGQYVLDLAKEDPGLLSSSLVLQAEEEPQLFRGKPVVDEATGKPKPPLWRPTAVHGSDIVDTGDAVDGLLSASLDALDLDKFDNAHRAASLVLDKVLAGMPRSEAERRLAEFARRYLACRYGVLSDTAMMRAWAERLRLTLPDRRL